MKNKKLASSLFISSIVLLAIVTFFIYPKEIMTGTKTGMILWYEKVFPSLFPFMVGINLLNNLGAISFIGTLLTPIMQPLFGVDGIGIFPLTTGFCSGYPMGAKVTSELYSEKKISKADAQKLLAFTNNCGPLFIIGAIGVGMYKNITIGYFLLISHYSSAIILGFLLNIYCKITQRTKDMFTNNMPPYNSKRNLVKEGLSAMNKNISVSNSSFGKILSESVYSAVESSLLIGGFIILFSVISTALLISHIPHNILALSNTYLPANISKFINEGLLLGIIEMTNGIFILSQTPNFINIILTLGIVTFGGLSVHAQAISFISKTDLNSNLYILSKIIQSAISILFGILIYPLFDFEKAVTTFSNMNFNFVTTLEFQTLNFLIILGFIIGVAFFIKLFNIFNVYSKIK